MESDYNSQQYVSRSRRSKKKKKSNNIIFLFIILLLVAFVTFFFLPVSKIFDISITGIDLLTEEEVIGQSQVYEGISYFLVNTDKIESELKKLHICKDATIKKTFPSELTINILENAEVAYLFDNDRWYTVLENGYITDRVKELDFNKFPLITAWEDKDLITNLAVEINKTKKAVITELSEIQLLSTDEGVEQVLIFTREGYKVHLELKSFSSKMNIYLDIVDTLKSKESGLGNIYLFDSIRFEKFAGE